MPVSPLAGLVLLGFLFVIALCLAIWAALSLAGAPDLAERDQVSYVPLSRTEEAVSVRDSKVWRAGSGASSGARPRAQPATSAASPVVPVVGRTTVTARVKGAPPTEAEPDQPGRSASNDDHRGARARVTQRPNLDDAFERFLDNERKDR